LLFLQLYSVIYKTIMRLDINNKSAKSINHGKYS
jgi:hypothetical protein